MKLRLDTWALSIDVSGQRLAVRNPDGSDASLDRIQPKRPRPRR